jgi:hypothetical protein
LYITNINPKSGSLGGGYSLTITGSNFAPALGSSQVFIGDGLNSMCTTTSRNSTQFNCTMPAMLSSYTAGDNQTVVITARIT